MKPPIASFDIDKLGLAWAAIGRLFPETAPDGDEIDGPTYDYYHTGALTQHPEDFDFPQVIFYGGNHDAHEDVAEAVALVWNTVPMLMNEVKRLTIEMQKVTREIAEQ